MLIERILPEELAKSLAKISACHRHSTIMMRSLLCVAYRAPYRAWQKNFANCISCMLVFDHLFDDGARGKGKRTKKIGQRDWQRRLPATGTAPQ